MSAVLDLPTTRAEGWRWSDPAAIAAAAASPRAHQNTAAATAAPTWLDISGPRLLFVDGALDRAASDPGPLTIEAQAPATEHPLGARAIGNGWVLPLPQDAALATVQIVHVSTGGANHLPGRIALAADAVASVVETFVGAGWANRFTMIELARSARLIRAVRIVQDDGFVSLRDEAVLAEGASLVSVALGAGGMGSRIDAAITLAGEGAFAEYGGALLTAGTQGQECAVAVRHAARAGTSRQTWRAVAADTSRASLAARVEVARDAQATDGEQSLRGLLLKRAATINLKPELEIFADDVKCAHGATVGELDRQALFYLAQRGLPPARAQALLTHAFVADALDRIGDEVVRDAFVADADAWLERTL